MTGQESLPYSLFRLDALPERERFEVWKESISCIFSVEAEKEIRADGFDASLEAYLCGQIFLAKTQSVEQTWSRTSLEIARDGMDHYMFQVFTDGAMHYEAQDDTHKVESCDIVVFDLSRRVESQTPPFTNISVVIPRDLIEPHLPHPGQHHLRRLSTSNAMVRLFHEHILSLYGAAGGINILQANEINPATVSLAAAALNGSPYSALDSGNSPSLAQSILVKRAIDQHLHDETLSPEALSKMVGISRSKLYGWFESHGGVAAYLKERRLKRAMSLLVRPEAMSGSVSEIAFSLGFKNISSFTRAFKARFEMTPRDARHLNIGASNDNLQGLDLDRRYEDWLRDLSL